MIYSANQQKAIDTINNNLQIIACAGSGKTQVISERIINILKNKPGIKPENIVAFTYTEKAAAELKSRVLKLCKEQVGEIKGLVEMYIGTIHAWCLNALQTHIYEYQKFSILDEVKQKLFIDKNYENIGMKELNMERFIHTDYFINLLSIVRESVLSHSRKKWPPNIMEALKKYENTFLTNAFFDFSMIMTKVLEHFNKKDDFSEKLKNRIKYLIVDEYQDVNPIQEKIIQNIADFGANVCVVGDDDQTIYQWRGSDVNYILNFNKQYKAVEAVDLTENFRSSPGIIDLATKTIVNNSTRLPKIMTAKSNQKYEKGDILFNPFNEVEEENNFIADQIEKMIGIEFEDKQIKRGIDFSDICILLRKWKKAENLVKVLEKRNIPFIVSGVNELFERPEVRAARNIFEFLAGQIDDSVLIDNWKSVYQNIKKQNLTDAISYLEKKRPEKIKYYADFILQEVFQEFLDICQIREENINLQKADGRFNRPRGEIIFYNLGMFSKVIDDFEIVHLKTNPKSRLNNFLNFLKYAANDYYPEGWLNNNYKTPNAVQIMTIYQAKGLEFPVVFIPGLNKNYLPSSKKGGLSVWHFLEKTLIEGQERYEGSIEDERRLFYVALTRSQKFLFITRAPDGRMQGKESPFIKEFSHSQYIFSNKRRGYDDRPKSDPQPKEQNTSILLNFSVLKNYFECPYRFKLLSMYGFQSPLSIRLGYGRSLHNILMEVHKESLEGKRLTEKDVPSLLETHVHIPYAYDDVVIDIKRKTEKIVNEYLQKNREEFDKIEFAEKEIQFDLDEGIIVNGRIDLIKKQNIDGSVTTTIIDFKSAEDAQTYDVSIEQLSLYAIGYKELSGENADFLEIYNMDQNKPQREEIQFQDLNDMKKKIAEAAANIKENNLPKTVNAELCQSCRQIKICSGCTK